jgi:hypothetical protein
MQRADKVSHMQTNKGENTQLEMPLMPQKKNSLNAPATSLNNMENTGKHNGDNNGGNNYEECLACQ